MPICDPPYKPLNVFQKKRDLGIQVRGGQKAYGIYSVAEDNGKPVGFGVTLNDINEVTIGFKKGRLFPFNIFKLLRRRHKTRFVRILALGVKDEYRKRGIEAIFFARNILMAREKNVIAGEVSWVLENNAEMVSSAEKLNSELYKRYRIYRFNLS